MVLEIKGVAENLQADSFLAVPFLQIADSPLILKFCKHALYSHAHSHTYTFAETDNIKLTAQSSVAEASKVLVSLYHLHPLSKSGNSVYLVHNHLLAFGEIQDQVIVSTPHHKVVHKTSVHH